MNNDLEISNVLVNWYQENKRDLPWRKTTDPYLIWISEIMLQQTRVAQGLGYYIRFVERFPTVSDLAKAEEDEVLKYWQGLGYYSRARNLHMAAKSIVETFNGIFPTEYESVLALKGIGEYTAAAIVSFAWNKPYPVVDGNVYRVLSRLFGLNVPIDTGKGKKEFAALAMAVMNPVNAGLHNQAIMEFGALQCTPQTPDCAVCPLQNKCVAYSANAVLLYPVKQGKVKTRNRYFNYFHINYKESTYLNRRAGKDIWIGLYEFPMIETEEEVDFISLQQDERFKQLFDEAGSLKVAIKIKQLKHVLSHQIIYATFYHVEIENEPFGLQSYLKVSNQDIDNYAVPRLVHIYLEKLDGNFAK